jgi:hypothetical protein
MPPCPVPPLIDALTPVPDRRQPRGRRHPLPAILALLVVAMPCDRDGLRSVARWGREQGAEVAARLGFTRAQTPCAATLHRGLRGLDAAACEQIVAAWMRDVAAALGVRAPLPAIAIAGKTLRGSGGGGLPAAQVLGAFGHELGLVLAQGTIDPAHGEQAAVPALLAELVLTGRVVTVDALPTQAETAAAIVGRGGTT